ncbi:FAD-dependent oxidoreductase [Legionella sp. W05-934-2]|jgi:monoamine oxidase|uniref:FAD-dependent oxidoreductase n=1 Tax=Legionella sp. W05-934-2 TaxID=1198649 RepID=UPI003462A318
MNDPAPDLAIASTPSTDVTKHCYAVIVIGAGIAGLTAAEKLIDANQDVLLLESRDRIGGRIDTNYSWGEPIELGASWLHGSEVNPAKHLFRPNQLVTNSYHVDDSDGMLGDFALYDQKGQKIASHEISEFKSLIKDFLHSMETTNPELDFDMAFNNYAISQKLSDRQEALLYYALQNIYTYEYAESLKKLGFASEEPYINTTCDGKNALVVGGFVTILEEKSKKIPILFHQGVRRIDYSGNVIHVDTDKGHFQAKKVLITVPLGVLKANKIQFSPNLPIEKQQAIRQLEMGIYDKLYLKFDHVFWDRGHEWIGLLPKQKEYGFNIFNFYKYTMQPILLVFISGQLAHEKGRESLTSWAMKHLRTLYGNDIPEPTSTMQTNWADDPNTLGSYSYLPYQYDAGLYQIMANPVTEKLFFAGEATSTTDPSTIHGAYLSGLRAADEILSSKTAMGSTDSSLSTL